MRYDFPNSFSSSFLGPGAMFAGLHVCARWLLGFLVLIGCGCSGGHPTADPGPPPPHGGMVIFFPDGSGCVEVVKKEGTYPISAELSFYFFTEGYVPYEPVPTSGLLVINKEQRIFLQAEGDALVTPTGPVLFGDQEIDGVLSVELDGEARQIPLGIR